VFADDDILPRTVVIKVFNDSWIVDDPPANVVYVAVLLESIICYKSFRIIGI